MSRGLKRKQPEPTYSEESDNEDLDLVMEDDESDDDQIQLDQLIPAFDKPKKTYINDEAALEEKLDEIKLRIPNMKVVPWDEVLDVTSTVPIQVANPNDDLEREAAFYTQVKDTVTMAINKLESEGIPWRRPDDYFAEMLKTDEHMLRVKDKLLGEKARVEKSNEVRKQRENKKFAKKVQQEKLASRDKQKKEDLDAIKKWRKNKQHGEGEEFDMDMFNKANGKDNKNNNNNNSRGPKRNVNHKRLAKDSKYGFGGKKSGRKRNDANSAGDTSGWSTRRNKDMKGFVSKNNRNGGGNKGAAATAGGGSRPGKRARQGQNQGGNKRPAKRQRTH